MASVTEQLIMRIALIDAVTRPLEGINSQIEKVSKAGRQGWSNMAMGATTLAAGGMAIQSALGPAIEMDRALGEVASLDVQKNVLGALGREALALSVKYGESATEIVRSSYDIQSAIAGLEGNELPAFTRASTILAKATKADTATITNYMGTMYGIFEQQAKMMGKANWVEDLAGKTATAVQMFKTTGQGMADAFGAIGANATAAGISMNEQFAVLGQLQATMSGGEAGTKFKSFLAGVGGAQKALGMQFTDSAGNMLPVLTVLDKLKLRYGETLSVAEGDELKKAFGSDEAVAMIKLLMTNTKALSTNINALANTHGMGKAEQMAASMTDQWQRVEQGWFAIRAAAFGVVLPAINAVVGAFADGANDVLRWTHLFPNLTKVVSYAMLAIVGLSMVTGAWMLIAGIAKLATLGLGIALAIITSPITAIVLGIVAMIAAIAAGIIYWDEIKATLADIGVFDALRTAFDTLLTPWRGLIKLIKMALDASNKFLGTDFDTSSLDMNVLPKWASAPSTIEPPTSVLNSPLASYRQGGQSSIPSGGIGQQLIQANAAATTANQKPAKAMHIGEVHNHFQNQVSPGEMEQELWMTTP
ncbi:phage tail tape measure protein [Aeromonas salmonicida]|uniref:phage tail tape measure protein n=1 Tax=Aeromonas salmonicida TaxID=645 RepID=UPI00259DC40D|nr:phage tail tape measure protein [Aeromonas salmonicida]MDM5065547.1 phage tail tape measure protein [Aeromonas salmonicida]